MPKVTLIRHGQAQTGATDEAAYDSLSDLGHQQARWLGQHFRETGEIFDRVYAGTLVRHQETASGIAAHPQGGLVTDARLNEVAYFDLSNKMHQQFGLALPTCRDEFLTHLPLVFTAWQDGKIDGIDESFHDFQSRVDAVLHEIAQGHGKALVVTSGGLIGMVMRVAMGLELGSFARLCLAVMNTSVHRLDQIGAGLSLTQFNAVPHLETQDRQAAKTYI